MNVKVLLMDKHSDIQNFEFTHFGNFSNAADFVDDLLPKISIDLKDLDVIFSFDLDGD